MPILEYNCVTWSPQLWQDIEKIERVQIRYTKRLYGFANVPYSERLRCLQLHSLESPRLFFDLFMCYRLFLGLWPCVFRISELNCASQTSCHSYKLYKRRIHSSVRAYFAVHIINVYGIVSQLIVWIFLLLLLLNAQLSKLILHRFYRVIVIDFDSDYFCLA